MLRQLSFADIALVLAQILGFFWVWVGLTHVALSLWLRNHIKSYQPAFAKVFYGSPRFLFRTPQFMQTRYFWPWTKSPIELSQYSTFVRALFSVTRIAGTIAAVFLIGALWRYHFT
jgi:hypothetical protein